MRDTNHQLHPRNPNANPLGTSVSPSPILWMRDTNHQLHPRDMKSMTHISKWVLTVHTKSKTGNPAQQVIPDGPGMVSDGIQYTIHRTRSCDKNQLSYV